MRPSIFCLHLLQASVILASPAVYYHKRTEEGSQLIENVSLPNETTVLARRGIELCPIRYTAGVISFFAYPSSVFVALPNIPTTVPPTTTTRTTTTTTVRPNPVVCPSNPPACSANTCQGTVVNGVATCKSASALACTCVPSITTPGFSCGNPLSCDLNNCAGTFDQTTGRATCKNAFAGCGCLPNANTCGARGSCDNNNCGGSFNLDTGRATCKNFFAGCECTPTTGTCGARQSCDNNNCGGSFNLDTGRATCKNFFASCECTPTAGTCGAHQSCDNNNCGGTFNLDTGRATCKNFFAGCECTATGNTCGGRQSCDNNDCRGTFDLWTNTARCRGKFEGCECNPTDNTCGSPADCDANGCNGTFDGFSNTARCRNAYQNCVCRPRKSTCGAMQSCLANGCGGKVWNKQTRAAVCETNYRGCPCNAVAGTPEKCGPINHCEAGNCQGRRMSFGANNGYCTGGAHVDCVCALTANTPPFTQLTWAPNPNQPPAPNQPILLCDYYPTLSADVPTIYCVCSNWQRYRLEDCCRGPRTCIN